MLTSAKSSKKNKQQNLQMKKQKPKAQKTGGRQASVAAAYATPGMGKAPTIKATRDTCNIKHRELLGNIQGSDDFFIQLALSLNPGLSDTFPWLSIMAQGWEEYRFRSLRFLYKTRTGSNTPGSVIMAPDYDAADAAPASEQIMSTYSQAIEDAPWKDITCNIKTSNSNPLGKRHFVRSSQLEANLDVKTYDIAKLFVASCNGTAIPWGKLWVEYDIDFFVPQLPSSGSSFMTGGRVYATVGNTPANPLSINPSMDAQASGFTVDANSTVTVQKPGYYLVVANVLSGTGVTDVMCTAVSNCSLATNTPSSAYLVSNTSAIKCYFLTTTAADAKFSFTAAGTTVTNAQLLIAKAVQGSLNL